MAAWMVTAGSGIPRATPADPAASHDVRTDMQRCRWLFVIPLVGFALFPAGCSLQDSATARKAQTMLMGMSEPDLEACLGVPAQHSEFGNTSILTWTSTLTSSPSVSLSLPVTGGLSLSGGGSCGATIRLENGRVTEVRYTGENGEPLAPNAYCAPIVRSCVQHPEPTRGAVPPASE